jgi:hypothetical protein
MKEPVLAEIRVKEPGVPLSRAVRLSLLGFLIAAPAVAQVNYGELRLKIEDPSQAGVQAMVRMSCAANGFEQSFTTSASGELSIHALPFGLYQVEISKAGFSPFTTAVQIRSAVPVQESVHLAVGQLVTQVNVTVPDTLIDPQNPTSAIQIGPTQLKNSPSSLPGRSIQDLVNSQPGWLYEGNAVLHPRGSEYQTQFVVDGIPLTDNRSPGLGPEMEAGDIQSISVYTAGYPAEFGRKMGGVVELDTRRQVDRGVHGNVALSGGSYDTASAYGQLSGAWGKNAASVSASGNATDHYLNPVVPENFTNNGTSESYSGSYERDITANDRMRLRVSHESSRFLIPNELLQQQAGQRQHGENLETIGTAHYEHMLSPDALIAVAGMVRDTAYNLNSNPQSTPLLAFQNNDFREGYLKGTVSWHRGKHEFKAGIESDAIALHEYFHYQITNPGDFDPATPSQFTFADARPDLEQAAFVEDMFRADEWTVRAGLRWDHYQLLLNQNAWSPRLSLGRYVPAWNVMLHASYDRIFQTPSFENILISSSPKIDSLNPEFLRLPVRPSSGNYFEGGISKGISSRVRLDANVYRRDARNFADDDQLLSTGVSYPISFDKGVIYGAESKVSVIDLDRWNGFVSYSYMVGNVWFPVTGGLFLGDDVNNAVTEREGHFPNSQDQRNTLRSRFQYQVAPRLWLGVGAESGSGLPFEYTGTEADALAQYGAEMVDRLNFARGRIRPTLSVDASAGLDLYRTDRLQTRFQIDATNLNNRLNVVDFVGLFSGNAIAPGRSVLMRLNFSF